MGGVRMPTKIRDLGRGRPEQKPALTAAIQSATILDEPRADWVPLWRAPFYCTSAGYILSLEKWVPVMAGEVEKIISRAKLGAPSPKYVALICLSPPEWRIDRAATEFWIHSMNISMRIAPGSIYVSSAYGEDLEDWSISGSSDEILNMPEWEETPPHLRVAAQWHQYLLEQLFWSWHSNFVGLVESGAAQIMARKNSILAPFERITWDQWQFFKLNPVARLPETFKKWWHDPRSAYYSRNAQTFNTATGPSGETLYVIYIAPGKPSAESTARQNDPEEKCWQWLLQLMQDYPDRAPKPLEILAEDATVLFPGLSKRGFRRCFYIAKRETGNGNWSKAGAPKKPLC